MKDWILFILATAVFFSGLTNLVLVRTIRRHLKATADLASAVAKFANQGEVGTMRFVIMLKDNTYWIGQQGPVAQTTGSIDAATKYESRWLALTAINKAGPCMHMASIVDYKRPSERVIEAAQTGLKEQQQMGITKVTAVGTMKILPSGRWIIVLPSAQNWAWTGARWVQHRDGFSREAQVSNFATEREALDYAREHLLEKQKV